MILFNANSAAPFIAIMIVSVVIGIIAYLRFQHRHTDVKLEDYDDEALQKMAQAWQTVLNMLLGHIALELRLGDVNQITEKDFVVDQVAPNKHKAMLTVEDYIIYIYCDWMPGDIVITVFKRNDFGTAFSDSKKFKIKNGSLDDKKLVKFLNNCYVQSTLDSRTVDDLEEQVIVIAKTVANEADIKDITHELIFRTLMTPTKLLKNKRSAAAMEMKVYLYAYLLKTHTQQLLDIAKEIQLETNPNADQDPQA